MGALSNIDPTAVAVWASAVVLFALIAVLRAVFKLNFSLLTVLALGLGIALSLVFDETRFDRRAAQFALLNQAMIPKDQVLATDAPLNTAPWQSHEVINHRGCRYQCR